MARGREDRHWKNARADLCGSAAGSTRIFPRRRPVAPETNRANRASRPGPKGFLSSLRFHHERLRALSNLRRKRRPADRRCRSCLKKKLSDRAFHLELDQPFQFYRIFHRKLANEVVNKAVYA